MILKLAVRNAFRNWKRNILLGVLILISTLILIYYNTVIYSMKEAMTNAVINNFSGHLQIQKDSDRSPDPLSLEDNWDDLPFISSAELDQVQRILLRYKHPYGITAVLPRVRLAALLTVNGEASEGSFIYGVDPEIEFKVSKNILVLDGSLLSGRDPQGMLLTADFARKINARLNDNVTALFYGPDGYLLDQVFHVTGIIDFDGLSKWGFQVAYISISLGRELLKLDSNSVHELVLMTTDKYRAIGLANALTKEFKTRHLGLRAVPWSGIGNFIPNMVTILEFTFCAFFAIILVVIIILLINLLFLNVSHRFKEIGTLRALGAARIQVIGLFVLEAELVVIFFTIIGVIFGSFFSFQLSQHGLDAAFSHQEYVYGGSHLDVIFNPEIVFYIFALYAAIGVISSLLPSIYAGRIHPVKIMK